MTSLSWAFNAMAADALAHGVASIDLDIQEYMYSGFINIMVNSQ